MAVPKVAPRSSPSSFEVIRCETFQGIMPGETRLGEKWRA